MAQTTATEPEDRRAQDSPAISEAFAFALASTVACNKFA